MEKYKNIKILYEDNHLLVVIKPSGMPVCPDKSLDIDLLTILKKYIKEKYHKPGNVYLGLVHRLDRPVFGIMVFAKTSKCAKRLSQQINNHTFSKTYYAIVYNQIPKKGTLSNYLKKNEAANTSYVTTDKEGKLATLDYETIKTVNNLNLVKINLHTGRHHQIRVQFSNINAPLFGDYKYNKSNNNNNNNSKEIALLAKTLTFNHPTTKELLTFDIELPKKYPWNLF